MAAGTSSKGTSEEKGTTSTQAHMTVGWIIANSDEPTTKPERRRTEDLAEDGCVVAKVRHISEVKPLVLLQVNCRCIYNKILEFWNLIDTYNPDVIGRSRGLVRKLTMPKFLGTTT